MNTYYIAVSLGYTIVLAIAILVSLSIIFAILINGRKYRKGRNAMFWMTNIAGRSKLTETGSTLLIVSVIVIVSSMTVLPYTIARFLSYVYGGI